LGDASAQNEVGWYYENGKGVKADLAEAVKWYRKAADQGLLLAMHNLGVMLANGRGTAVNAPEALALFKQAAVAGNVRSQYQIGLLYDQGKGVAKDSQESLKWLRKSAEQGFELAQDYLGVVLSGDSARKNDVEAYMWFNLAAAAGSTNALRNRELILRRMTTEQVNEAQKRSLEFGKKPTPAPAPKPGK
jgi:hypothetical protein